MKLMRVKIVGPRSFVFEIDEQASPREIEEIGWEVLSEQLKFECAEVATIPGLMVRVKAFLFGLFGW